MLTISFNVEDKKKPDSFIDNEKNLCLKSCRLGINSFRF